VAMQLEVAHPPGDFGRGPRSDRLALNLVLSIR